MTRAEKVRDLVGDVKFLVDAGEDPSRIVQRLGTTRGALARRLYRHGYPGLARVFNAGHGNAWAGM